jgi:hypothetical protein
MSKAEFEQLRKELKVWINNDPFREALLIRDVPIAPTTLMQIKNGNFSPSERLMKLIKAVMAQHPAESPSTGGQKSFGT